MLSQATINNRIDQFPVICKKAGLKVTHQRTAVYSLLAGTESHPTPEDIYSKIRKDLPSISLATVYKILDMFNKHGFLRKVSTEGQVARYDANNSPHHHMVCSKCGDIRDVEISQDQNGMVAAPALEGFNVTGYDVIYHGTCYNCG